MGFLFADEPLAGAPGFLAEAAAGDLPGRDL